MENRKRVVFFEKNLLLEKKEEEVNFSRMNERVTLHYFINQMILKLQIFTFKKKIERKNW